MSFYAISYANLKKSVDAYKDSKHDEKETNNCRISLNQLEDFMNFIHHENIRLGRAKQQIIDGLRIYLVRSEEFEGKTAGAYPKQKLNQCKTKNGMLPQFSFVIVPTTDYKEDYLNGCESKDFLTGEFIYSITPNGETSGLCPNNCGGSE